MTVYLPALLIGVAAAFGGGRPAAFIEDGVAVGGALLIGVALR